MTNHTLYGSNADRLKKAMLQRSKPSLPQLLHEPIHSYDDIPVDPHHASMSTFASLYSDSSASTDSMYSFDTTQSLAPSTAPSSAASMTPSSNMPTYHQASKYGPLDPAPSLHSQYSSQHTLHRKHVLTEFEHHSPISHYGGPHGSPTNASHSSSEYSRFGRVVANSLNSYSSIDSHDRNRNWAPRRLFEKAPPAANFDIPVLTMPTTCTKAIDEIMDQQVEDVIGAYEDINHTQHSTKSRLSQKSSLTDDFITTSSSKSTLGQPQQQQRNFNSSSFQSSLYSDTTRSTTPCFAKSNNPYFDSEAGTSTSNSTDFSLTQRLQLRSHSSFDTRLGDSGSYTPYSALSLEAMDLNIRSQTRSPIYRRRRNSTSSLSSRSSSASQNSFMQSAPALNLDLDSVIRSALVESSTHTVPHYISVRSPQLEGDNNSGELQRQIEQQQVDHLDEVLYEDQQGHYHHSTATTHLPFSNSHLPSSLSPTSTRKQSKLSLDDIPEPQSTQSDTKRTKNISRFGNSVLKFARKITN